MRSWRGTSFSSGSEHRDRFTLVNAVLEFLIQAEVIEAASFGTQAAMRLVAGQEFAAAESLITRLLPLARKHAAHLSTAQLTRVLSELRFRQGRWDEAFAHSGEVLERNRIPQVAGAWVDAASATTLAAMGRADESTALVEQALVVAEAHEVPIVVLWCHAARGHLSLSQNRVEEAVTSFWAAAEAWNRSGLQVPTFVLWAADAAEAAIRVGDAELERVAVATLANDATPWTQATRERIAMAHAESSAAIEAGAVRANELYAQASMPFEVARTDLFAAWGPLPPCRSRC